MKRLVPVWTLSLANEFGEQAQPLVYNGVLYAANVKRVVAIDIGTGRQIWETPLEWDPAVARVVCCGLSNRGVALYDGKVFVARLDAHLRALDAKTGKEIWKTKVAEWKEGYSITSAPTRGERRGDDRHDRRRIRRARLRRRLRPADRARSSGGATRPRAPARKATRPGRRATRTCAAARSTWITGSYDPELDLTYWGTSNGGPWGANWRPGDNLWVASVIAIRPKTGEIAWHYQWTPAETYDFDGNNENVLARHDDRRPEAQGADARRPQRLSVRARPHQRAS